jgi:hypothetical protein
METTVQAENHARSKTFELSLLTRKLHGNGLKRKVQSRLLLAPRVQQLHAFLLAPFEALTPNSMPQITPHD